MNVLITGAAGNLGGLLAKYLRDHEDSLHLILMQHQKKVAADLRYNPKISIRNADLARPETLTSCLQGADLIVHFAGVLFRANPEKFLYQTNIQYFKNLVKAAQQTKANKIILISFPHVEGPTSKTFPAVGRLDRKPMSIHAQTRLEEEKYLFNTIENAVSLRVGMVYGSGILMIDAAKWFARKRLLGVWRQPTPIHLISKTDFCRATTAAIKNDRIGGIYHVGDEGHDTLQSFFDLACDCWGYRRPWRMPLWLIYSAAEVFELVSKTFGIASPLTKDFIDIGRVSYYGDTHRFREELLPRLTYRTIHEGLSEMT